MGTLDILEKLAREHRERMNHLTWSALAEQLSEKPLLRAGETWGMDEGGQYYDVGDTIEWVREVGGDIRHTYFASEDPETDAPRTVSFIRIVKK